MAPLAGLKVVEIGQVLAGPFAGAIFSDLGAQVIKIERPEVGDDARLMGKAFRHGDSLTFQVFNRGKQSVTLDLKSAEGIEALHAIVADADVLVHNLRPGVPADLGIDGPTMCARHPRLVYAEMSAFGHRGPMADRPGYEPLIQAYSGLSSINGDPDGPPVRIGASVCDQGTGMWVVIGALSLLQRRAHTGLGGIVQGSLLETALTWSAQKSDAWLNEGALPQRHASGHPGFVPYEAFDASDAPLLICVGNDRLFVKFAQVLGRPDWTHDARFRSNRDRLANNDALLEQIRALMITNTRDAWIDALEDAGVPCAPLHTLPEAMEQPQVQALGLVQHVPGEDFRLTGLPLSFDGERPAISGPAPRLGADNARHLSTAPSPADQVSH
ncbi:MAG: CoA transferase [Burkholderiales bacterium]|nr:CoA transferase [Burkholderiales bacterium]